MTKRTQNVHFKEKKNTSKLKIADKAFGERDKDLSTIKKSVLHWNKEKTQQARLPTCERDPADMVYKANKGESWYSILGTNGHSKAGRVVLIFESQRIC